MNTQSARDELAASANRLAAHLPNIDKLMTELAAVELREKIARKEELFARECQPFKRIKPLELLMADLEVPREGRKFLVLDGPSRTGKKQFIMSLFGGESALQVSLSPHEESPALRTSIIRSAVASSWMRHPCHDLAESQKRSNARVPW